MMTRFGINLNRISFAFIFALSSILSVFSSDNNAKSDECNGILIEGYYTIYPIGLSSEGKTEVLISVYLRNTSKHSISLPLGAMHKNQQINMGPIVYSIAAEKTHNDEIVKFPDSYYNFVNLLPGQITKLPTKTITLQAEKSFDNEIDIIYTVDNTLKDIYESWTGSISTKPRKW